MLLAWFVFSWLTFTTCVRDACCESCSMTETVTEETTSPPVETSPTRYPIDFEWNNAKAFTNDGFDAVRSRIISEMGDDNTLVITGRYFASEEAPPGFASMGLARAAQLRDLLAPEIDTSRVVLTDLLLDDSEAAKTGFFESADFEWRDNDAEEEAEIVQLSETKIAIRFPYSSAVKDTDPTVDEYLETLSQRLQQTTERVRLVGHTDNRGTDEGNMKLSERRAKYIRDVLVDKGIDAARIEVDWKGESSPTSSNETEEGRHNNRRVELEVLAGN
jgi:outer membrane protein OmpA-like peptidoglycan-associated protein